MLNCPQTKPVFHSLKTRANAISASFSQHSLCRRLARQASPSGVDPYLPSATSGDDGKVWADAVEQTPSAPPSWDSHLDLETHPLANPEDPSGFLISEEDDKTPVF